MKAMRSGRLALAADWAIAVSGSIASSNGSHRGALRPARRFVDSSKAYSFRDPGNMALAERIALHNRVDECRKSVVALRGLADDGIDVTPVAELQGRAPGRR